MDPDEEARQTFKEWCARAFLLLLDSCHLLISVCGHMKQPVCRNPESADSRNNQDTLKE